MQLEKLKMQQIGDDDGQRKDVTKGEFDNRMDLGTEKKKKKKKKEAIMKTYNLRNR